MQTFLPYANYAESARSLDVKRLGKQRSESIIILKTLLGLYDAKGGWPNHPATKMWRGYEMSLLDYSVEICIEWQHRGYKDTCLRWLFDLAKQRDWLGKPEVRPPWVGWLPLHESHKSNLIRKDPEYYLEYWPNTPDNLPYLWPQNDLSGAFVPHHLP